MDLDFWDCFGNKKNPLSHKGRNKVMFSKCNYYEIRVETKYWSDGVIVPTQIVRNGNQEFGLQYLLGYEVIPF